MTAPRCGKPVRRKEQGGVAVLEDPACGLRENHRGRCRSEASVERARLRERERRDHRQRQQTRLRRTRRLHENLSAVIAAAVAQAEHDARSRDSRSAGWPVTREAA